MQLTAKITPKLHNKDQKTDTYVLDIKIPDNELNQDWLTFSMTKNGDPVEAEYTDPDVYYVLFEQFSSEQWTTFKTAVRKHFPKLPNINNFFTDKFDLNTAPKWFIGQPMTKGLAGTFDNKKILTATNDWDIFMSVLLMSFLLQKRDNQVLISKKQLTDLISDDVVINTYGVNEDSLSFAKSTGFFKSGGRNKQGQTVSFDNLIFDHASKDQTLRFLFNGGVLTTINMNTLPLIDTKDTTKFLTTTTELIPYDPFHSSALNSIVTDDPENEQDKPNRDLLAYSNVNSLLPSYFAITNTQSNAVVFCAFLTTKLTGDNAEGCVVLDKRSLLVKNLEAVENGKVNLNWNNLYFGYENGLVRLLKATFGLQKTSDLTYDEQRYNLIMSRLRSHLVVDDYFLDNKIISDKSWRSLVKIFHWFEQNYQNGKIIAAGFLVRFLNNLDEAGTLQFFDYTLLNTWVEYNEHCQKYNTRNLYYTDQMLVDIAARKPITRHFFTPLELRQIYLPSEKVINENIKYQTSLLHTNTQESITSAEIVYNTYHKAMQDINDQALKTIDTFLTKKQFDITDPVWGAFENFILDNFQENQNKFLSSALQEIQAHRAAHPNENQTTDTAEELSTDDENTLEKYTNYPPSAFIPFWPIEYRAFILQAFFKTTMEEYNNILNTHSTGTAPTLGEQRRISKVLVTKNLEQVLRRFGFNDHYQSQTGQISNIKYKFLDYYQKMLGVTVILSEDARHSTWRDRNFKDFSLLRLSAIARGLKNTPKRIALWERESYNLANVLEMVRYVLKSKFYCDFTFHFQGLNAYQMVLLSQYFGLCLNKNHTRQFIDFESEDTPLEYLWLSIAKNKDITPTELKDILYSNAVDQIHCVQNANETDYGYKINGQTMTFECYEISGMSDVNYIGNTNDQWTIFSHSFLFSLLNILPSTLIDKLKTLPAILDQTQPIEKQLTENQNKEALAVLNELKVYLEQHALQQIQAFKALLTGATFFVPMPSNHRDQKDMALYQKQLLLHTALGRGYFAIDETTVPKKVIYKNFVGDAQFDHIDNTFNYVDVTKIIQYDFNKQSWFEKPDVLAARTSVWLGAYGNYQTLYESMFKTNKQITVDELQDKEPEIIHTGIVYNQFTVDQNNINHLQHSRSSSIIDGERGTLNIDHMIANQLNEVHQNMTDFDNNLNNHTTQRTRHQNNR